MFEMLKKLSFLQSFKLITTTVYFSLILLLGFQLIVLINVFFNQFASLVSSLVLCVILVSLVSLFKSLPQVSLMLLSVKLINS